MYDIMGELKTQCERELEQFNNVFSVSPEAAATRIAAQLRIGFLVTASTCQSEEEFLSKLEYVIRMARYDAHLLFSERKKGKKTNDRDTKGNSQGQV